MSVKLGNRVTNLGMLKQAALNKKSVTCPALSCWKRARPAAFMMNLQGAQLLVLFEAGMYVYGGRDDKWVKPPWSRKDAEKQK